MKNKKLLPYDAPMIYSWLTHDSPMNLSMINHMFYGFDGVP